MQHVVMAACAATAPATAVEDGYSIICHLNTVRIKEEVLIAL